ncbi:MAG: MBL fold metallo-hydrolase [Mycobacteriales bacterium]
MKLTVLGCAGTFPGPQSGCSAYLVEYDGFRLMVDAGNGAIGALQRHCGLFDVDAVLLSHLHADHCVDMIAYAYARIYHPFLHPPPLPVYGPAGTEQRLLRIFDSSSPEHLAGVYDFHTVRTGRFQIGPFDVTAVRTAHPVECYAVRLAAGDRSLAYSADTGPTPALIELARGVNVFLCEASWLEDVPHPPGVHLTGRQAGEHAAAAQVHRLLLTHLVAWSDAECTRVEAHRAFAGEVLLAAAGASYEI